MLGSFTARRMRSAWPLVACLAVTVLMTAALVSALVSFYADALPATVNSELAGSGAMWVAVNGDASGPAGAQATALAARFMAAFGAVPIRSYEATWSDDLAVPGLPRAGQVPVVQAAAVGGLTANARLSSGSWPSDPRRGAPIPTALPVAAAAALGLHVGSVLSLHDLTTGSQVSLQVTGLFRPERPAASYWQLDLIGPAGSTVAAGFITFGPAVVSPAAFSGPAGRFLAASQVSYVALPRVASIRAANLTPLARHISAAASAINSGGGLTATTGMPETLANTAAGLAAARSLVVISGLQLLLLAGAALALVGRLLAGYREGETALLAARGAARRQLVGPSLAEAILAVAASAVAGVLTGSLLSAVLATRLAGRPPQATALAWPAWPAAAVLAVFCAAVVIWPALRPSRPAAARIRRGRSATVVAAVTAGADIALLVLALLAVRELRSYSAAAPVGGGPGVDPVIAAAPALALVGLAVLPLRLLPAAARGLERLSARSRRLGSALANWEISRRPLRQSGPALLVILAVGASTLALAQYETWQRSVRDQAAFAVGAPVRVDLAPAQPLSGVRAIAGLPTVTSAMPVSAVPLISSGPLLVLDAALAARTVTLRPDLAGRPVGQLFSAIATRAHPGLALPGRPARIEIIGSVTGPAGIGPVSATVTVQDAYGVGYAVATTAIPADGKPHALVARLGGGAGAAYPLRLIGISVSYTMPAYPRSAQDRLADQQAVLELDGLLASPAVTGQFSRPVATGRALGGWLAQAADPGLAAAVATLSGASDGAVKPSVVSAASAGSSERITFRPGNWPLITQPPGAADLDFDVAPAGPVPAIATAGYASANGLRRGSVFAVPVAGQQVSFRLAATVAAFPAGAALVADQAAVQDALASQGDGGNLLVTAWWLATSGGAVPAGLPAGAAASDTAALAGRLEHDPLSAAPVQAAAVVAAAAAVLAALGFCVSVAASARERRPQRALLGALGVPAGTQAGLFCLEEGLISIPAAGFGLAIGVVLAHLLIPALTVTATGGLPVPPVVVVVPWGWVLAVAIGLLAIPVAAAAVSAAREPDPAAELRATEAVA